MRPDAEGYGSEGGLFGENAQVWGDLRVIGQGVGGGKVFLRESCLEGGAGNGCADQKRELGRDLAEDCSAAH
jgi:hypothetical protein